jgi:hypothetical protein
VQVTKFLQWFVVHVQDEALALEVFIEEVYAPNSYCSFQKKW